MGEEILYQPLTQRDKITVALYRAGIVLSTLVICIFAYMLYYMNQFESHPFIVIAFNVLLLTLYGSVGLSVFFIHLYVSRFHRTLKRLYYLSLLCLGLLYYLGYGDALAVIAHKPYGPLLMIPLSLCIGFITAKEAFCFRLMEGYIIALLMPFFLMVSATGMMPVRSAAYGLIIVALLLVFFNIRKVFMPIHYDIGDKSAYQ